MRSKLPSIDDVRDKARMAHWLAVSVILYGLAMYVEHLQIQTLLWKLGHLTVGAHLGYWVAREALGRIYGSSPANDRIARAIVIVGAMFAVSQGL